MVVFGGTGDIPVNCQSNGTKSFSRKTWLYDDQCGKWVEGPDGPSARGRHSAAAGDGAMWVFGGRYREGDSGDYTLFDDLLRFDFAGRTWRSIDVDGAVPSARATSAMTYDGKRKRLWVFGGNSATSGLVYTPMNDLWAYDIEGQRWLAIDASNAPPPRLFHSLVYDAQRDWLVVFGGANETAFDNRPVYFKDVWAYDIGADRWLELQSQTSSGGPRGRFWSSLVHDTDADAYVVFGGHDPGALTDAEQSLGNLNDTWRFDPDSRRWSEVAAGDQFNKPNTGFCNFPPDFATIDSSLPERRSAHTLVWNAGCGYALLFGGKTDCGSTDDVWSYADQLWQPLLPALEGEVCHRWRDDLSECTDICF